MKLLAALVFAVVLSGADEFVHPQLVSKVEPAYSQEAREAKISGTVLLRLTIDEDGLPQNIRVVRALGYGLDEKAIEALIQWRFRPARKNGKVVSTDANVEINFRLLESPPPDEVD